MPPGLCKTQINSVIDNDLLGHIDEMAAALEWSRSQMIAELLKVGVEENYNAVKMVGRARRTGRMLKTKINSLREALLKLVRQDDLFEGQS